MDYLKRSWCEINLDFLHHNMEQLQKAAGKELIAVVKADAYGHGDSHIVSELEHCGIRRYAVSNFNEAMNLRRCGIQGEILILGYTPPELAKTMIDRQIIQTVHCTEYAEQLNAAAAEKQIKVHLKIDTGMSRIGFAQTEFQDSTAEILNLFQKCKSLNICGIFTHFSCSDSFDPQDEAFTQKQMKYFDRLLEKLKEQQITFESIHAQNSAGITNYHNENYNCARAGIFMYGLNPSSDIKGNFSVSPLLSWKTVVTMVKEIPAGAQVSYGRTFTAEHPMKIATLAVGYADGYSRRLSSKGDVLIHGRRCRILGRVCMDQMMVDVSSLEHVKMGDIALLIGQEGNELITAEELAQICGTIGYEIICNISRRVPRVYLKNGREIDMVDYSIEAQ